MQYTKTKVVSRSYLNGMINNAMKPANRLLLDEIVEVVVNQVIAEEEKPKRQEEIFNAVVKKLESQGYLLSDHLEWYDGKRPQQGEANA